MLISLLFSEPVLFLAWVAAILITLTVHEFAHAASAKYFGDNTAEQLGRLTLNPLAHLDPLGFLMLLFIGFGWAKPVPVNNNNLRNERLAGGLVSAAGPASNLAGAVVFGLLFKIIFPGLAFSAVLTQTFMGVVIYSQLSLLPVFLALLILINVILMVFNLIPLPPLDGSKVLFSLLPDRYNDFKMKFSLNGPFILLMLILADSFLNLGIFSGLFNAMIYLVAGFLG